MKTTAEQRRVFGVTKEEADRLAANGFEPRVVWVRLGGIDMSARYTKREALKCCVVPSTVERYGKP